MAWLVIKDETPYDGDKTYVGVFHDEETANSVANWEREKAEDWVKTMREIGEKVGDWVPEMSVEWVKLDSE